MKILKLVFVLLVLSFSSIDAQPAKQELKQEYIRFIVKRLVSIHYSHQALNDKIAKRVFKLYLRQIDPRRHYFLSEDINSFQPQMNKIDDALKRGDVTLALDIFDVFKERYQDYFQYLQELAEEKIVFDPDMEIEIDRSEASYPNTQEEAKSLWRTKFQFDMLTATSGSQNMEDAKKQILKNARSVLKHYAAYSLNEIVALYLNALANAYDPHTTYLPPVEKKTFDINIRLSLEGIGASLRWEDGYTIVASIIPGGAAERQGDLKPRDRITAVSQGNAKFESVIDWRINDVIQLIRGKRGTKVRLRILRQEKGVEQVHTISIIRDKIILKAREAKSIILNPEKSVEENFWNITVKNRIGIIRLPSFYTDFEGRKKNPNSYKSAYRDVRNILFDFKEQGVEGVILDLRNNGGGGLGEAIDMGGLFLGKKPMVAVRSFNNNISVKVARQAKVYHGPLLILQSRASASASEILAGALQDYGRAIIVGDEQSFGKGTVQSIDELPANLGALKITIAQFYRVSGGSTQNEGIASDIVLPSVNDVNDIGESFFEYALPWKSINPVRYHANLEIKPYIEKLRALSQKRVKQSEDFQDIVKEIKNYQENIKSRKISTIGLLQKEYEERKKRTEATLKRHNQDSENQDKNRNNDDTNEESSKYQQALEKFSYFNPTMQESILILQDYIHLLKESRTLP